MRLRIAVATAALLALTVTALAAGGEFSNGGFENGNLSGWTKLVGGSGKWTTNTGGNLPVSGAPSLPPLHGKFDAVFDQGSPSFGVLYHDFVVPPDGEVTISYAYLNQGEDWLADVDPFDLETDNQWLSIDVMVAGSDPFSFDSSDIIQTVVRPGPGDPFEQPWTDVTLDLSAYIGQTVRIRYATADTEFFLTLWADGFGGFFNPEVAAAQVTHAGYCTVPGNTREDGSAIPVGTFVQLEIGQPGVDAHYKGAQPANFVQGMGITCDQIPLGFTLQGFADESMGVPGGLYPYYAPPLPATSGFRLHWNR